MDETSITFQNQSELIFMSSQFDTRHGSQTINLNLRHAIAFKGQNFPKNIQGLFLWPAAEAMAEFSLQNAHLFVNKSIIEIGAGIGLLGLSIASLRPSPERVVLTDGCQAAVDLIQDNMRCASPLQLVPTTSGLSTAWSATEAC